MSQPLKLKYPCSVCHKNVNKNHKAIEYTNFYSWSHIKCNNGDQKQYNFYQNNPL